MKVIQYKTEDLIPYENNPRKNEKAVDYVAESIKEFGFKSPIIVDENNVIIAGHTRLEAAKKIGLKEVPVIKADDLTPEQAKAFRLADNKTAEFAEWDESKLINELLSISDIDMDEFGFSSDDVEAVLNVDDIAEDEVPEPPKEPKSKPGDIYKLGKHRLMCGDSTKAEDVKKLMDGEKADLVVTDPPYGVSYTDKNEFLNAIDKGTHIQKRIENDSRTTEEMKTFWVECFHNYFEATKEKMSYYIFGPQGKDLLALFESIVESGFMLKHNLVWVKNNHVLGRSDYSYKHEPICYGWKPNGTHAFYTQFDTSVFEDKINVDKMKKDELVLLVKEMLSDKTPTDVIYEDKPLVSDLHPTMKPVKLIARLINNSSRKDELVLDLFGGSGTTLIAAEQIGRKCNMMELDPHYVDVIIERWENLTGKKAEKIS